MTANLKNKTVILTGAGGGIGRAIAEKLAAEQMKLILLGGNHIEKLNETAAIVNQHSSCIIMPGDLTSPEFIAESMQKIENSIGGIDVLINNAGVAPDVRADLLEMGEASFDRVLGINLKGPFFLTQAAANMMISAPEKDKFRCIINIGSVSADYASINRGEYCLSKAAVAMATKLFAVRLAEENICVYEIRPGVIKSDMTSVVTAKYDKMIAEGLTLQRRWGMPEDIGRAVLMLVNGSLAYSTGQVINVDGGLTVERF
jgi:NAD(P)-dependent dehydrogenase (short-subunit alcohol dehydrogenase family)